MTKPKTPDFAAIFASAGSDLKAHEKDLLTVLDAFGTRVTSILDGGISVADNLDARTVVATSPVTPGNEFHVAHGLGKVPTGYIVVGQDKAGHIYKGATANDRTNIYFKSDTASVAFDVLVF